MIGDDKYSKLLHDCKGGCASCPFLTCHYTGCEELKHQIKENMDTSISIMLKEEYK